MLFEISLKHILNALPYIARNFSCLRFPDTCLNRYLQYCKFITCFLLIIQIRKIPGMIVPV